MGVGDDSRGFSHFRACPALSPLLCPSHTTPTSRAYHETLSPSSKNISCFVVVLILSSPNMPACSCGRNFCDAAALSQHQKTKRHASCNYCTLLFSSASGLQQHILDVHSWPCGQCNAVFGVLNELVQHLRIDHHNPCKHCECAFSTANGLQQHILDVHNWFCGQCNANFKVLEELVQHQRSNPHNPCKHCKGFFSTASGLQQHILDVHNWPCKQCNAVFGGQEELIQHQKLTGHCYCRTCNRFFEDKPALRQHLRSPPHVSQFHCCDCDRDFVNEHALKQHLTHKIHKIQHQSSDYACKECDREFRDNGALQQHQASVIHHPLSDIRCIANSNKSKGCLQHFRSPSALLHHLESGNCPSGTTRRKLNAVVQENDIHQIISGPTEFTMQQQAMVMSGAETPTTSSDIGVMLTPSSSNTLDHFPTSQILTPQSSQSTDLAIFCLESSSKICPLCPKTRRPFPTSLALQQHLCSPAHTPKMFHCPVSFFPASDSKKSTIKKSFSTLSGLAQHLESGVCEGGQITLQKAVEYIEVRLRDMGMMKVKLLI